MEKKFNFEENLKELETIVNKIQNEELPLKESMELFAKGKELVKELETSLNEAEGEVKEVLK